MSITMDSTESAGARAAVAAQWLLRLQGDEVAQEEVAAWLEWCYADPRNLAAFDAASALYDGLQMVDAATRDEFMALVEESPNAAAIMPRADEVLPQLSGRKPISVASRLRSFLRSYQPAIVMRPPVWTAAALGVAALLVSAVLWNDIAPTANPERHSYQAPHGTHREVLLADRSKVTLGSESSFASNYTAQARHLTLAGGEAFFEVQPDRTRPFVVRAGAVTVTAIGTAFNVRRTSGRIVVAVTEGAVDVAMHADDGQPATQGRGVTSAVPRDTSGALTPVRVRAGQQAIYAPNQRGVMVSSVSAAAALAWQNGRFEYTVEPLSSVIDDVNRYATHRIRIADAQLSELVFTGTVFREQVDEWVRALDTVFPLQVVQEADGTLTLQARD
jgi:transmembrane sensor